jgi:hypothetical protein
MSYSTALETIDHLNTADMKYINEDKYTELRIKLDAILNKLNSLYKYQINNKETLKKKFKKVNRWERFNRLEKFEKFNRFGKV